MNEVEMWINEIHQKHDILYKDKQEKQNGN
jgi:hypothetical protein